MTEKFKLRTAASVMDRTGRRILSAVRNQRLALDEFSTMRHLRNVVKEYGITKPLFAFANHNNTLTQAVSSIPATESLNNIPLSARDRKHLLAMEGLDEVVSHEPRMAGMWTKDLASDLEHMLASTAAVVEGVLQSVDATKAELENREVTDVVLDTTIVTTRTAEGFSAVFSALTRYLGQIGVIDVDSLFTSEEYRKANMNFIEEMVADFKPMIGYTLRNGEFSHEGADEIDENYAPREGSLSDLGYGVESFKALLESVAAVLHAVVALSEKKDEIVAELGKVSERLETPTDGDSDIGSVHGLVSNYAIVIVMLLGDALYHVHEIMSVVEDVVEHSSEKSDDGHSD